MANNNEDINVKIGADASELNGAFEDASKKVKSSTESMSKSFEKAADSAKTMSSTVTSSVKGLESSFSGVNKSAADLSKMLDVVRNTLSTAFKMDGLSTLNAQIAQSSAQMKKLSDDAAKAGQDIVRTNNAVSTSFNSLNGTISGIRNAIIAAFSIREIVDASDSFMKLQAQLRIATGSMEDGEKAFVRVKDIAIATRQSIEGIGAVYRRLSENAVNLGMDQEKVARTTETVAKAMALGGEHAGAAKAALIQFQQALSSGVLRGQEFNSVMEQAPYLARLIADGLGVPINKLRSLANEGKITAFEIIKGLEKVQDKVDKDFAKVPITIGGAMENVKTQFVAAIGEIQNSTGVFSTIATAINGLATNMGTLITIVSALSAVMIGRYVGSLMASIAAKYKATVVEIELAAAKSRGTAATIANTAATEVNTVATTIGARASAAAGVAMGALGGPIGLATTLVLALGTAFISMSDDTDRAMEAALSSVTDKADSIMSKISDVHMKLKDMSRDSVDAFLKATKAQMPSITNQIGDLSKNVLSKEDIEAKRKEIQKYKTSLDPKSMSDKTAGGLVFGQYWDKDHIQQLQEQIRKSDENEKEIKRLQYQWAESQKKLADIEQRAPTEAGTGALENFAKKDPHNFESKRREEIKKWNTALKDIGGIDKLDLSIPMHKEAKESFDREMTAIDLAEKEWNKRLSGPKAKKGGDVGKADLKDIHEQINAEINELKSGYKLANEVLDDSLAHSYVSYKDYRDSKINLVKTETASIIALKEQELAATEKLAQDPTRDQASRTRAEAEVKKLKGEIKVLNQEEILAEQKLNKQYEANIRAFKDQFAEMKVAVKDAAGEDAFAERMEVINRKFEETTRKMGLNAGDAGYEIARKALNIEEWKAKLAEIEKAAQNIDLKFKVGEAQINGDVARGSRDEFSGARKLLELKQQMKLEEAEYRTVELQRMIEEGKLTDKQIEQERLKIELLKNEAVIQNEMAHAFDKNLQSGLSTMLEDVIGKTKTLKQAFGDMVQTIRKNMIKEVSDGLSKKLMGSFSEMLGMSPGAAIYGKDENAPIRTGAYEGTKQGVLDAFKQGMMGGSVSNQVSNMFSGGSFNPVAGILNDLNGEASGSASKVPGNGNIGDIVGSAASNAPSKSIQDLIGSAEGSKSNAMQSILGASKDGSGGFLSGVGESIKAMFSKVFSTDGSGGIFDTVSGFFKNLFSQVFSGGSSSGGGGLMSMFSGSGGSSGGGFMSMFSGSEGGGGIMDGISSMFGGFFADGGSVSAGKLNVVGERGPELFIPNSSGTIVPNHALGGGTTINMQVNANDANSFRKSMGQIQAEAAMALSRGRNRYS